MSGGLVHLARVDLGDTHSGPGWSRDGWSRNGDRVDVRCPDCGRIGELDHDVAADGRVSPSLDCPQPACGFHAYVVLDDWLPRSDDD